MKPINRLLLTCIALCTALGLSAQNPQATLNKAGHVKLPTEIPLNDAYEIDISGFDFADEMAAVDFFRSMSGQKHFYRPVVSQQVAILYLQRTQAPDWTVADWNAYLQSKSLHLHEEMTTPLSE